MKPKKTIHMMLFAACLTWLSTAAAAGDVRILDVEARQTGFWEVNNPEDVPRVEAMLAARGLE